MQRSVENIVTLTRIHTQVKKDGRQKLNDFHRFGRSPFAFCTKKIVRLYVKREKKSLNSQFRLFLVSSTLIVDSSFFNIEEIALINLELLYLMPRRPIIFYRHNFFHQTMMKFYFID